MSIVTEKICVVCGKDVSGSKRTKDAAGRYYCQSPCWQRANRQQPEAATPSAASGGGRSCANCQKPFGALEAGIAWDAHRVCSNCADALQREAEVRAAERAERERVAAEHAASEQAATARAAAKSEDDARLAAQRRHVELRPLRIGLGCLAGFVALVLALSVAASTIPSFSKDYEIVSILVAITAAILGIVAVAYLALYGLGCLGRRVFGRSSEAPAIAGASPSLGMGLLLAMSGLTLLLVVGTCWTVAVTLDLPYGSGIGIVGGLLAGAVAVLVLVERTRRSICPSCGRYWVADVIASQFLDSQSTKYNAFEDVHITDPLGNRVATASVPTQKERVTTLHEVHCRCRNCNHQWAGVERRTA